MWCHYTKSTILSSIATKDRIVACSLALNCDCSPLKSQHLAKQCPHTCRAWEAESAAGLPEAAIAQLGERQTEDLKVPVSIPGLGTFL